MKERGRGKKPSDKKFPLLFTKQIKIAILDDVPEAICLEEVGNSEWGREEPSEVSVVGQENRIINFSRRTVTASVRIVIVVVPRFFVLGECRVRKGEGRRGKRNYL